MDVKIILLRFLKNHTVLVIFLVLSSIIAAIVYEVTGGGKPKARVYDHPRLNTVNLFAADKPREIWDEHDFECLGWKATHGCDPYGPRDYSRDRACDQPMPRVSGFCEVRNRSSGEIHRVMLATCKSWQWYLVKDLTCNDARLFTDFSIRAAEYQHPPSEHVKALGNNKKLGSIRDTHLYKRGVVMIGYPKVIAGLYAVVRLLRYHGCALPVEVWIDPMEMRSKHSVLVELAKHYNVIVRTILDPNATKFHAKPYAIYHSRFESVLFLDSDNIPVDDPTYLFDSPEFVKYGAMFWPDFWRPAVDTPFNVHEQSVLWPMLDMPFTDMFEQESGQLLINKTRSQEALNKLMFYASHVPRLLTDWRIVWGDKDLFRLAWLNTSTPFYMVQHLVALGGLYDANENFFCGVSMIQRDPNGNLLFIHRNQAKLTGRRDQKALITHMQKFTGGDGTAGSLKSELDKYRVQCKMQRLGQNVCFLLNPKTPSGGATPMLIQSLANTKYPQVEMQAIHFSIEGRSMFSDAEDSEVLEDEEKELAKQAEEMEAILAKQARSSHNLRLLLYGLAGLLFVIFVRWRLKSRAQKRGSTHRPKAASVTTSSASSSSLMDIQPSGSSSTSNASFPTSSSWRQKKSIQHDDSHIL